ncbi:MAG: sulfatase [Deltaproteobacteria bacterium]|nr:sulfatase [Deltaproteobacteria bacterium]
MQPNQTDSDAVSVTEKTNVKKTSATHPPKEMSRASLALFGDLQKTPVTSPVNITPLKNGNVVLLIFDALNAGHLSAYGYTRKTSPHIDDIAEDGLILTNHVSNSTWTRPSFTTVVTGVPKSVHGVEAAGGWRLEPEIETLAERFRQAGYNTAGFTGNPLVRKSWGFDQGYQLYEGPTTRGLKAFPNDSIWVDAAIKWLGEISEKRPFFLMMFLTSAHPPYRPPQKPRTFLSQVPKGEIIEHPYREYKKPLSKDDDMRIEAAYDDEIAYMDTQVHRLISHLKKTGRLNNTVVAMTADHGEMMGEHNCYLHAYHMWEQNTRVPFIISAPNLPLKNAMDDRPYTHVDIAPTLLDMVGIACDGKLKGRSLVKTLAAPNAFKERFRYTQVDAHGVSRQMIRHKDWKIVHHDKVAESTEEDLDRLHPSINQPNPRDLPSLAWDKERWELYDLNADAREENNLFNTPSAKPHIDELQSALDELRKGKKGSRKNKAPISPQLLEALKNAGYIR